MIVDADQKNLDDA